MPVLAAYTQFFDDSGYPVLKRAINHTARANHELTQDIILRMTEFIAGRVAAILKSTVNTQEFKKKILAAMKDMYPTTQEVVGAVQQDLKQRKKIYPELRHVVVPFDFDGKLSGKRTGGDVPSTKGRALNWGLSFLNPRSEICGFYDAESRPHWEVLLYVGYKRLLDVYKRQGLHRNYRTNYRQYYRGDCSKCHKRCNARSPVLPCCLRGD